MRVSFERYNLKNCLNYDIGVLLAMIYDIWAIRCIWFEIQIYFSHIVSRFISSENNYCKQ